MIIEHTEEFDLAYRFVTETNENLFITGKAGTGKTTFLKYLRENSVKNIVVAAPTGVAAINARGVTLHSLFQLPFGVILPVDLSSGDHTAVKKHPLISQIRYSSIKLELLRSMEVLIIDEVSMVTCFVLDAIDILLRNIKKNFAVPFGGVQVVFIGDLYQLPPVVKNTDWEILRNYYNSIFFFDSYVLRNSPPLIIELKEIFRQKDNTFIEILNEIRNNNVSEESYRLLSSRLNRNFYPDESEGYITLTTHNYQADAINREKLNALTSPEYTFTAEITGEFPENAYPAEKDLVLKCGSQVMFLKNDNEGKQYFNGKIGIVTHLSTGTIRVRCKDQYEEIEVKKSQWNNIRYKLEPDTGEITEEILGTFLQYPLRLAWANTIHKSQGLTFEKVIIDAERAFALGQVYVALSRCTTLEGLILRSPVYSNYFGGHHTILEWQHSIAEPDFGSFTELRRSFIHNQLDNIFNWSKWHQALDELGEFLLEKSEYLPSGSSLEIKSWFAELISLENKCYELSEKQRVMIKKHYSINSDIENNIELQAQIKDAVSYFSRQIELWRAALFNHPLVIEKKNISTAADRHLQELSNITGDIIHKLSCCRNGFILDNYLSLVKSYNLNRLSKVKSSYSKKKKETLLSEEIRRSPRRSHPTDTIQETIDQFLRGKSIEEIAAGRNLVPGTIESHLAKAVRNGIIQINDVMDISEAEQIAQYFPREMEDVRLTAIKETIPFETTYAKLKIVFAWLQRKPG